MNQTGFEGLLSRLAQRLSEVARGLKDRLASWLKGRKAPKNQDIVEQLRDFDARYLDALSEAFGELTGQAPDPEDIRRWMIGDVTLSQRLYRQHVQTAARVRQILSEHARYGHDARKLAMDLYEGYGFRADEVLKPKVRLPKYLDSARLNREVDILLARIQASNLKTPALRAGYLQMLDAILGDAGQEAIDKALSVAVQERYRYFANRIAQTELARTHHDQIARELMADPEIQVVRYRMSGTHPAPDLCDVFAKSDRYGLGPGLYPKALAPKPPMHPHCRCVVHAIPFANAARARYNPSADAAYLRSLDPRTAARVAGSKAKREEILKGANAEAIWNQGRPEGYRIGKIGDVNDE